MFLILLLSSSLWAQESGIFKDLRTYYQACGVVGKDDARFESCNPPNMQQIMTNFQKDPKNIEDMKKISRFHMTHSLQAHAKMSLLAVYSALNMEKKEKHVYPTDLTPFKSAWAHNSKFVITLAPGCKPTPKTSLELGQKIENTLEELTVIKKTIQSLSKYPCPNPRQGFLAFAVGVVDPTGKPDVWMMNEKNEIKQIGSSTGKTPFE
jgi:hypothetical protein